MFVQPEDVDSVLAALPAGVATTDVPFLDCSDLAVFKAYFNRTKDWADLEEMAEASTLDLDLVVGTLTRLVGTGDERVARLISLAPTDRS